MCDCINLVQIFYKNQNNCVDHSYIQHIVLIFVQILVLWCIQQTNTSQTCIFTAWSYNCDTYHFLMHQEGIAMFQQTIPEKAIKPQNYL